MLVGDRLIASFQKCTEYWGIVASTTELRDARGASTFDASGVQYVTLAGFDRHDNSYWYVVRSDGNLYAVFSRTGRLIAKVADSLHVSLVDKISPFGDIYKSDFDNKERIYRFYRIRNIWDPVVASDDRGSERKAVISTFSASTSLAESSDKNAYHPVKLFDGDPKTMWMENAKGPGIGESVAVGFDAPVTADEMQFEPGCFWPDYWKQNYRVKQLQVKLDDKTFTADFKDEMVVQSLKLDASVTFKAAVFTIKDVYPTTKWEDTAISEIAFYNHGTKIEVDSSKYKDFLKKAP
jgi:hypothetical protein